MMLAALSCLAAVAMGAFAAHGVADPKAAEWLRTGALYQFMHSIAVIACAVFAGMGAEGARRAPPIFLIGIIIFCGSLYAMAFGAPRWFGAITPIGGLLFMAGWAMLAWSARKIRP